MNITRDTTNAAIMVPVVNARQRLAEATHDLSTPAVGLAGYMTTVAEQEGKADARKIVRDALNTATTQSPKDFANARLMNALLAGPDDTYSGRGNDVRRAYFDGFLKETVSILKGW